MVLISLWLSLRTPESGPLLVCLLTTGLLLGELLVVPCCPLFCWIVCLSLIVLWAFLIELRYKLFVRFVSTIFSKGLPEWLSG